MTSTPDQFLAMAEELAHGTEPRHARAAIHQAYYAVYHLACQHLDIDPTDRKNARHAVVWARIERQQHPTPCGQALRVHGQSLLTLRERADYRLKEPVSRTDAGLAVLRAQEIFSAR